jgi:drug/metabolite transporter (DMT)-like permease
MLGVVLISWQRRGIDLRIGLADLSLAALGAVIRGTSLVLGKAAMTLWHSPLAAVAVGYCASACTLIAVDRWRRGGRPQPVDPKARAFFVITGLLNGLALFAMYRALETTPVSIVAPVVAALSAGDPGRGVPGAALGPVVAPEDRRLAGGSSPPLRGWCPER